MKDDSIARQIGERVRQARKAVGMTQAQLSGAEFSKSFISQVEKGQTMPSVAALLVLSKRLGRPVGWFMGEGEEIVGETGAMLTCPNCCGKLHLTVRTWS